MLASKKGIKTALIVFFYVAIDALLLQISNQNARLASIFRLRKGNIYFSTSAQIYQVHVHVTILPVSDSHLK